MLVLLLLFVQAHASAARDHFSSKRHEHVMNKLYYYDGVCERIVRKVGDKYEWKLNDYDSDSWHPFKAGIDTSCLVHKQSKDYYACYRMAEDPEHIMGYVRRVPVGNYDEYRDDTFFLHDKKWRFGPVRNRLGWIVSQTEQLQTVHEKANPDDNPAYSKVGKMHETWKPSERWFDVKTCPNLVSLYSMCGLTDALSVPIRTGTLSPLLEVPSLAAFNEELKVLDEADGDSWQNLRPLNKAVSKLKTTKSELYFTIGMKEYAVKVVSGPTSGDIYNVKYIAHPDMAAFPLHGSVLRTKKSDQ